MFSYVDLVRAEIAIAAGERFGVVIEDAETDRWRTLGDVARSVASHAAAKLTDAEIFESVRTLIAEGYGTSAELSPDGEAFGDHDRATAWFFAPPYPKRLGDRWFALRRHDQSGSPNDDSRGDHV